jgi:small acid-soluble spore protein H (minor)
LNRHRAEEIAQSPDMKHVTYNGQQVYIQHVHEQSNTARIFPLDQPENEFDVQLENLLETNRGNA